MQTWNETRSTLGLTEGTPSAEFIRRATAPARAAARAEIARTAAAAWAETTLQHSPEVGAWMACAADAVGIGGHGGSGVSGGTSRFPAFAGCGKGRKFAGDGGAWDAAISAARTTLGESIREANPDPDRRYAWPVFEAYTLGVNLHGLAVALGDAHLICFTAAQAVEMLGVWAGSVARRGLLFAAFAAGVDVGPLGETDVRSLFGGGGVADWAALVDEIDAALEQAAHYPATESLLDGLN